MIGELEKRHTKGADANITCVLASALGTALPPAKLQSLYWWNKRTDPSILWRRYQRAETHSVPAVWPSDVLIRVVIDTGKENGFLSDKGRSLRVRVPPRWPAEDSFHYPRAKSFQEESRQRPEWGRNLLFCPWTETETNPNILGLMKMTPFKNHSVVSHLCRIRR